MSLFNEKEEQQIINNTEKTTSNTYSDNKTITTLYFETTGSGPYHEEEIVTLERIDNGKYVINHKIIAPMAGCFEHHYCFDDSISCDEFTTQLYKDLPYVSGVFPKDKAISLWKSIVKIS